MTKQEEVELIVIITALSCKHHSSKKDFKGKLYFDNNKNMLLEVEYVLSHIHTQIHLTHVTEKDLLNMIGKYNLFAYHINNNKKLSGISMSKFYTSEVYKK